mgnify:CR=1 FL=1
MPIVDTSKREPVSPDGYVFKSIPLSQREALRGFSFHRAKTVAKAALQNYIASFLDEDGVHSKLIQRMSPNAVNFVTSKSWDGDITKRNVQLARLFSELREKLPTILIVDGDVTLREASLGGADYSFQVESDSIIRIPLTLDMPLSIVVGGDESNVIELVNLLLLIFGPLRRMARIDIIQGDIGESWELRFPLTLGVTSLGSTAITEDPKDQVWTATFSIDFQYEDIVELSARNFIPEREFGSLPDRNITGPTVLTERVYLGIPQFLSVEGISPKHVVYLDHGDIASISSDLRIRSKKIGTFKVLIADAASKEVLYSKDIEVVP